MYSRATAALSMLAILCLTGFGSSIITAQAKTETKDDREDSTIRPDNGFGIVKLGIKLYSH